MTDPPVRAAFPFSLLTKPSSLSENLLLLPVRLENLHRLAEAK